MGRPQGMRKEVQPRKGRWGWSILLLLLFLAARATPEATVHAAQEERRLAYGESVGEILTANNPSHTWLFEGRQGDIITIEMNAVSDPDFTGLDPFLVLEYEDGTTLAEDDDGGNDINSRIENFELPADGTYVIVATSFSGEESGRYELSLNLVDRPARHVEYMGAIPYQEPVTAELTPEVVAHVWEFEGAAGDEIAIAMNALSEELDPFLLLLEMGDADLESFVALSGGALDNLPAVAEERGLLLAANDDQPEGVNAQLPSVILPNDDRYVVVATSCCTGDSAGPYELLLEPGPSQAPGEPGGPVPILGDFFPREGQAGTDVTMILEGDNFSELGSAVSVVLGGMEIPVLGSEPVDASTVRLAIRVPEDTPLGEQPIMFFFENGTFEESFVVGEPDGAPPGGEPGNGEPPNNTGQPGVPGTDGGGTDARQPPVEPPTFPWLPIVLGAGMFLGLLFLTGMIAPVAWRWIRPPKPIQLPTDSPPAPAPAAPAVRFERQWDPGSVSIEPAGRPLHADLDIRFKLSRGSSAQRIEEG